MLFISCRKGLGNEDEIGQSDEFWDIRLRRGMATRRTQLAGIADVQTAVAGKRVLTLVHGYNNEFDDVVRAYAVVEQQVNRFAPNAYDQLIGYTWPGGDDRFDYFAAKTRSGAVAPRFCDNLRRLHGPLATRPAVLDLMTHSMGARVALMALGRLNTRNVVRNLLLMGSAVDDESIERNQEYFVANSRARNSFVLHSMHDQVLGFAFRIAEFDRALGQNGPEDPANIIAHSPHTLVVNCKHKVRMHGDYKRTDDIYKFLARNADSIQAPQFSTL